MRNSKVKTLVLYALFIALTLLLGLSSLGYIYLPFASVTIVHIPVIIAAYLFGIKGGALIGFFFGLTSLIQCFMAPDMIAMIVLGTETGFGIYNLLLILVVLFLPRILTGVFAALVYKALARKKADSLIAMGASAVIGSLTNTVLLLGALYIFAYDQSAAGFGLTGAFTAGDFLKVLLGIVSFNGLLEAAAAMIISTALGKVLIKFVMKPEIKRVGE